MLSNQANACSLSQLPQGMMAKVVKLDLDHLLQLRLNAMGLIVGHSLEILRQASMSGPLHIRLKTTELILRKSIADKISVIPS